MERTRILGEIAENAGNKPFLATLPEKRPRIMPVNPFCNDRAHNPTLKRLYGRGFAWPPARSRLFRPFKRHRGRYAQIEQPYRQGQGYPEFSQPYREGAGDLEYREPYSTRAGVYTLFTPLYATPRGVPSCSLLFSGANLTVKPRESREAYYFKAGKEERRHGGNSGLADHTRHAWQHIIAPGKVYKKL